MLIAGTSKGPDQAIFEIPVDTWFNLRTGVLTTLNYDDPDSGQSGLYTFDSKLDGQAVKYVANNSNGYTQIVSQALPNMPADLFQGSHCMENCSGALHKQQRQARHSSHDCILSDLPADVVTALLPFTKVHLAFLCWKSAALQVKYVSPQVFYGVVDNEEERVLPHYLYPPPAPHSLNINISGDGHSHELSHSLCPICCICHICHVCHICRMFATSAKFATSIASAMFATSATSAASAVFVCAPCTLLCQLHACCH